MRGIDDEKTSLDEKEIIYYWYTIPGKVYLYDSNL